MDKNDDLNYCYQKGIIINKNHQKKLINLGI